MNKIKLLIIIIMLFELLPTKIKSQSKQEYADIGHLKLESGEYLYDCKVGYRIFGKMNTDKSNVILFPTWFGGTSKDIANLIGPKGLIDTLDFCIIAVDALANGVSTSPSNSEEQLNHKFPEITVVDMVNSQYEMLTKHFKICKLYAVIGGSMGGMQTFQWLVSYPDFMLKAVPYLGTPFRSRYDLLLNKIQMEIIEVGLKYKVPQKQIQFQLNMLTNLVARTPEYLAREGKLKEFSKFLNSLNVEPSKTYTLWNYLYQLKAMYSHNILRDSTFDLQQVADKIKADVLLIVSRQDHIVQPYYTLELAKIMNCKTYVIESDCGHLAVNCDLDNTRKAITNFLINE